MCESAFAQCHVHGAVSPGHQYGNDYSSFEERRAVRLGVRSPQSCRVQIEEMLE